MDKDERKISKRGLCIVGTLFLIVCYSTLKTGCLVDMGYLIVVGVYLTKYILLRKSMQKDHH